MMSQQSVLSSVQQSAQSNRGRLVVNNGSIMTETKTRSNLNQKFDRLPHSHQESEAINVQTDSSAASQSLADSINQIEYLKAEIN